jgi:hypothetical protein
MRLLACNLTCEPQMVNLEGLGQEVSLRTLDETNARPAMADPEHYRAEVDARARRKGGRLETELRPYAVLRVDWLLT